jgi:hypothetical protein
MSAPHKTYEQRKKLVRLLKTGMPIGEALRQAGWSELQSKKGRAAVPKSVWKMLGATAEKLVQMGEIDPNTQEKLVRGRLVKNVIQGSDAGAQSAKILGSDRRVNMWQPEIQNGLIIITPPASISTPEAKKRLLESDGDEPTNIPAELQGPGEYTMDADRKLVRVR